jgi:hypothetical protein
MCDFSLLVHPFEVDSARRAPSGQSCAIKGSIDSTGGR